MCIDICVHFYVQSVLLFCSVKLLTYLTKRLHLTTVLSAAAKGLNIFPNKILIIKNFIKSFSY